MDVEEQEQIDSVNRYIRGDKPVNICRDVGRSKTWLFTWVSRFENGEEAYLIPIQNNHDKYPFEDQDGWL